MDNSVLFKISYGLYIITARDGEKDNGCVINTLMQITANPLKIQVVLNKDGLTHDMIKTTGKFTVNLLNTEAKFETFKHFGFQSGNAVNKFDATVIEEEDTRELLESVNRTKNGTHHLSKQVNSYITANVSETIDAGTHTIFIADVIEAEKINDVDSLTYDYYQKNIKPKPETSDKKGWRCKICGYIYEGNPLPEDFICPICKHGAVDFEKI
ncbi:MAG: flavin reductase [Anaerovoracaceae bacterium]